VACNLFAIGKNPGYGVSCIGEAPFSKRNANASCHSPPGRLSGFWSTVFQGCWDSLVSPPPRHGKNSEPGLSSVKRRIIALFVNQGDLPPYRSARFEKALYLSATFVVGAHAPGHRPNPHCVSGSRQSQNRFPPPTYPEGGAMIRWEALWLGAILLAGPCACFRGISVC